MQDELLATITELVSVAASKDTRLREPLELPRPSYADPTSGASSTPAEVAAFFGMVYIPQEGDE